MVKLYASKGPGFETGSRHFSLEIRYLLPPFKPRSHALIYTRYVNYTYMYNLHPGGKNLFATRSHVSKIFWTKPCINPLV